MHLSTDRVQNLVDNEGTSSATPATAPDFDMLGKFQPEPWTPVSRTKERLILAALLLCVVAEGYLIYWMLT